MKGKDERKGWEERTGEKNCKERIGEKDEKNRWETEWESRIGGKDERKV
jgi:hypothetical protein